MGKPEEHSADFPMFFDLHQRSVLVVGAGKIAARRARVLAEFGARVEVVAPDGCDEMERLSAEDCVMWRRREFADSDICGRFLVVAATDEPSVNQRAVCLCREAQILVNHAGDKSQCDFYFPGIAREGNVVVGVTASGSDHRLAKTVTEGIREWMKEEGSRYLTK